mmetsp:Transcript_20768/g.31281  ORF Transcript_20768/g.31281 Transcript_20768/m.31281 type:complete len:295 (-) Transcript_20768:246-1130(-)
MFRAPEMVDLFMSSKLTQSTDVWALGCCLYSLAFLQNCFEEGSNLAILSRNYKIPHDNPYGDGLVELIDRMLTIDAKSRADMTEVILCLSALYSGRPLPARKKSSKSKNKEDSGTAPLEQDDRDHHGERIGAYRTDGQGFQEKKKKKKKDTPSHGKKLAQDSAAARRLRGRGGTTPAKESTTPVTMQSDAFDVSFPDFPRDVAPGGIDVAAFSTKKNEFPEKQVDTEEKFSSFDTAKAKGIVNDATSFEAFGGGSGWGGTSSEICTTDDGFPATLSELRISEEEKGEGRNNASK